MNRKLKQILSFGILFPSPCRLPSLGKTRWIFESPQTGAAAFTLIKIIEAVPQSKITLAHGALATGQICENPIVKTDNLVQVQHGINLNQPVECFNLANVVAAIAHSSLAVRPLARASQQIVDSPPLKIAAANYRHASGLPVQTPGMVPIPDLLIIFAAAGLIGRVSSKFIKSIIKNISHSLSLQHLQLMRC